MTHNKDAGGTIVIPEDRFWRAIHGLSALNAESFLATIGIARLGESIGASALASADRPEERSRDFPDRRTDSTSTDPQEQEAHRESVDFPRSTAPPSNTSYGLRSPREAVSDGSASDASGASCPSCGRPLEPASEASETGGSGRLRSSPAPAQGQDVGELRSSSGEAWIKRLRLRLALQLGGPEVVSISDLRAPPHITREVRRCVESYDPDSELSDAFSIRLWSSLLGIKLRDLSQSKRARE